MLRRIIPVTFCFLLNNFEAHALQTYVLRDQHKTEIMVSSTETNRISVLKDRIQQVFGVDESYSLETDEQGGQIFLKALNPGNLSPFTLTLVTEKGLTHDLRIKPQKMEAQSILLKSQEDKASFSAPVMKSQQELLDFIRDFVLRKERDDVFMDSHPKETSRENDLFKATVEETYEDDVYKGLLFKIKNKTASPLSLEPDSFALSDDRAVTFASQTLKAFGVTKGYVVRKKP